MKRRSNLFLAFFVLVLAFGSCTKEELAPQEDQANQNVYYQLGALLLPESEYAGIPEVKLSDEMRLRALPTSVNLVTPPVGNQGGEGSCVSWGVGYAGRSITWHQQYGGVFALSSNIFSPEFIYNQIKISTCDAGSYVTSGLNLLKDKGVCLWSSMPYTDTSCSTLPNETQLAEAANYKISSYAKVPVTELDFKNQLAAGKPIVVAGNVSKDFMYLTNGAILKRFKGKSLGGHCYCVVGYDDAKRAFKFQNSWGTGWGSAGFGWIDYASLSTWIQESYVLNN